VYIKVVIDTQSQLNSRRDLASTQASVPTICQWMAKLSTTPRGQAIERCKDFHNDQFVDCEHVINILTYLLFKQLYIHCTLI